MTVDLSKLEVGDTVELRGGRRLIVEQLKHLKYATTYSYILRTAIGHNSYTPVGMYWTHHGSLLDIVAIHKKEKPMEQQATEIPAAQALAEGKLGWYRTRDGELAEVLTITHPRLGKLWTVLGFYTTNGARQTTWDKAGQHGISGQESSFDLVTYLGTEKPKRKVKRTVEVVRWANVYPGDIFPVFGSKENADKSSASTRIACVELRGSYEVEEEVDEGV